MRIETETIKKHIYNRFGQGGDDYDPFTEWQNEHGGYEYSTYGPGNNEGIKDYTFNGGSHKIRYVHYVSPDILLVHQSKMVGFYVKKGQSGKIVPVQRMVKDNLLRDANLR